MFLLSGAVCSADIAGLTFDIRGSWGWLPVAAARVMWAIPAIVLASRLERFARQRFDRLHALPILMCVVGYVSLLPALATYASPHVPKPEPEPVGVSIAGWVVLYVLLFAPFAWLVPRRMRRTIEAG